MSRGGLCSFTSKGASCYDCVANASSCQPPDFCHTASCILTSCIFSPKNFTGSSNNCQTVTTDGTNPACFSVVPNNFCETGDPCYTNECVPTNTTSPTCIATPVCGVSDMCYTRTCDKGTCANQSLCTAHLENTCLIFNGCDPVLGCNYTQVTCDDSLAGTCNVFNRNSSYPGCCQPVPLDCSQFDQCYTYGCNMTDGTCYSTPKCNTSTPCFKRTCNPSVGECNTEPVQCPASSDLCKQTVACNESLGGCTVVDKCVSDDPCVTVTCQNGTCIFENVTCDDGNSCTEDSCVGGTCKFSIITCETNSTCYSLTCNTTALPGTDPCVQVPKDIANICNDNDPCTDDLCDDSEGGCYHTTTECTANITTCQVLTCNPRDGCVAQPRVCNLVVFENVTNTKGEPILYAYDRNSSGTQTAPTGIVGCSVAFCDEVNTTRLPDGTYTHCLVQVHECYTFSSIGVVALSAGIGGGVIAGIVLAVILFLSCTGGASYAAISKWNTDQEAKLQTNPLYEDSTMGGDNPLHKMKSPRNE